MDQRVLKLDPITDDLKVANLSLEQALEQEEVIEAILFFLQCVWNVRGEVKIDTPLSGVSECARDIVLKLDVGMCSLLSGSVAGVSVQSFGEREYCGEQVSE